MQRTQKIDLSELLGFNEVADELSEGVDLQHGVIDAKLVQRWALSS